MAHHHHLFICPSFVYQSSEDISSKVSFYLSPWESEEAFKVNAIEHCYVHIKIFVPLASQTQTNHPPDRGRVNSALVWAFGTWIQIHRQMSRLWQTTDKTTRTLVLAIIKRLLSTTPLSSSDLSDICNIIVPVNFSFALPLWSRSSSLHSLESLRTSKWLWYFM